MSNLPIYFKAQWWIYNNTYNLPGGLGVVPGVGEILGVLMSVVFSRAAWFGSPSRCHCPLATEEEKCSLSPLCCRYEHSFPVVTSRTNSNWFVFCATQFCTRGDFLVRRIAGAPTCCSYLSLDLCRGSGFSSRLVAATCRECVPTFKRFDLWEYIIQRWEGNFLFGLAFTWS